MQRVVVAADSGLDIPVELLEKYKIVQIPVHVYWRGRQYRDKLDLQLEDMFAGESKDFPTTSQPAPGEFAKVYTELRESADVILSWHIASALSGTWASAKAGADLSGGDARVLDTCSVSMGGGLQAVAAAEVLCRGGTLEEALAAGLAARDGMKILLVLDTLEYIRRGGRISRLEAALGSLLNIKPMLVVQDGIISSAGRARSRRSSLELLLKSVVAACTHPRGRDFVVAVGHACAEQDAESFTAALLNLLPEAAVIPFHVGVAIGAHGGPGVLGACFYNRPKL